MCVRKCLFSLVDVEKLFLHNKQLCGFSPVCVRMCMLRSEEHLNLLSQWEQG